MDKQTFRRAVWELGGATKVAATLGVSRQALYKWMERQRVPEHRVDAVRKTLGAHVLGDAA